MPHPNTLKTDLFAEVYPPLLKLAEEAMVENRRLVLAAQSAAIPAAQAAAAAEVTYLQVNGPQPAVTAEPANEPLIGDPSEPADGNPPDPSAPPASTPPPSDPPASATPTGLPMVGLALSGGGVRSATFCLGVVQAMASFNLLQKVDLMSSVSGGGYFGSFLGRLFTRIAERTNARHDGNEWKGDPQRQRPSSVKDVEGKMADSDSAPLRWLRENGRYLAPGGSVDWRDNIAVLLRNNISVWFILGLWIFGMLALVSALRYYPPLAATYGGMLLSDSRFGQLDKLPFFSPLLALPLLATALLVVPLIWAFWLAGVKRGTRYNGKGAASALILLTAASGLVVVVEGPLRWFVLLHIFAFVLAVVFLELALPGDLKGGKEQGPAARTEITHWLGKAWVVVLALLVVALCDALGLRLVGVLHEHLPMTFTVVTGYLAAIISAFNTLASRLPRKNEKGSFLDTLSFKILLPVVAFIVAASLIVVLTALVHVLAHEEGWQGCAWAAAVCLLFSLVAGKCLFFLNFSSLQQTYGARLARAYLGASNPARAEGPARRLTDLDPGDNIAWSAYRPDQSGGPLHIISTCVNETLDGISQREIRDRNGMACSIGPAGISVARRYHALWHGSNELALDESVKPIPTTGADPFHVLESTQQPFPQVEALSLQTWTAISGAAFSTGLGRRTSAPLSFLLGLAGVRLGYWWDSGIRAFQRPGVVAPKLLNRLAKLTTALFPMQSLILSEFRGLFGGPSQRYWYLSDGGHFENTGLYELLRRRLPLMICCDAGEDPDYEFSDLADCVRKARVDFSADISFQSAEDIKAIVAAPLCNIMGSPEEIRESCMALKAGLSSTQRLTHKARHVALARVHYLDIKEKDKREQHQSWLLLIKPSVSGDEPRDVATYATMHPTFPHETTADQVFDEAQWESYRKLGEVIGRSIFESVKPLQPADKDYSEYPGQWQPSSMLPPPQKRSSPLP